MKASVIYFLIIGLASATEQGNQSSQVEQVAQRFSWIGKERITTAQFKVVKQIPKPQQKVYVTCVNNALKVQKWCSVQDVDMFIHSIQV